MITIEETAQVDDKHQVTIPVPEWVPAGRYRAVLVLDDELLMKPNGAFADSGGVVGENAEDIFYGKATKLKGLGPRKEGLHRGAWTVADDFDAPLPDEFWLGGKP